METKYVFVIVGLVVITGLWLFIFIRHAREKSPEQARADLQRIEATLKSTTHYQGGTEHSKLLRQQRRLQRVLARHNQFS